MISNNVLTRNILMSETYQRMCIFSSFYEQFLCHRPSWPRSPAYLWDFQSSCRKTEDTEASFWGKGFGIPAEQIPEPFQTWYWSAWSNQHLYIQIRCRHYVFLIYANRKLRFATGSIEEPYLCICPGVCDLLSPRCSSCGPSQHRQWRPGSFRRCLQSQKCTGPAGWVDQLRFGEKYLM